jgi:class 3 adenylate cyclase
MAGMQRKSLHQPDDTEVFPGGQSREVHLGELVVARTYHEPGWRWSKDVKPIVGTTSCRFHHTGVVLHGRARLRMDDGSELELGPDDVYDIPPGHDAWVVGDEPFETVDWVGAHRWAQPLAGERILATVVMTDIVDSTILASRLGDGAWTQMLDDHDSRLRRVLDRFGGREVATTGDGMLAVFDGAERAVRAAAAMHQSVASIDLRLRTAVHTGEIERVPGNVRGVAVHIAARMLGLARPGEVVVSSTTRDLLADRPLEFDDRGEHTLRGVAGRRRLFSLRVD